MENVFRGNVIFNDYCTNDDINYTNMNLSQAKINTEYIIKSIKTDDEELKSFLFSLGCYKGAEVTLISVLSENYIIVVKDARYSIDKELAESIGV